MRLEMWVTEAESKALRSVAAENGLSLAALQREAINEFVADYRERVVFQTLGISSGNNSSHA